MRMLRTIQHVPTKTLAGIIAVFALVLTSCTLPAATSTSTQNLSAICSQTQQAASTNGSGDLNLSPTQLPPQSSALPGDTLIHLNIALNVNQLALDACAKALYDPSSPLYHQFLTPQQISERFAPATATVAKLESYLTSKGLQVTESYTTGAALAVDGTAQQIEQAFQVHLSQYQKGDKTVFTPDTTPKLPADVQSIVVSITGLDTQSSVHCNTSGGKTNCGLLSHYSHFTMPATIPPRKTLSASGDCTLANIGIPGIGGSTGLSPLLTWASLRQAYGLNTLAATGYDGSNTSIGMVEFDTYDPVDVNNYMLCANSYASNRIQNVVVVPGGAAPDSSSGAGEATLDLELAAGLTSKTTNIINYYAPNNAQWAVSFLDILQKVASDKKVSVLSISYGDYEEDMSPTYMAAVNDAMKILAAEGISVFVASGDCGAFGSGQYGLKALSFPASAPWAISVGGTSLVADALGNPQSETAWGNDTPDKTSCGNTWGTGGGVSGVSSFTLPAWQSGKGVSNQYSNGLRQVPDVAAAAINISFYFQGLWLGVGGTSAAAPIWATGVDIVNQALTANGKSPVGGVPNLYTIAKQHPSDYQDITKGSNEFYPATPGWDYTTGWGSPHFDLIAATLGLK